MILLFQLPPFPTIASPLTPLPTVPFADTGAPNFFLVLPVAVPLPFALFAPFPTPLGSDVFPLVVIDNDDVVGVVMVAAPLAHVPAAGRHTAQNTDCKTANGSRSAIMVGSGSATSAPERK